MPPQLSFSGFDLAPQPTDRLFFAIYPDVDAATSAGQLAARPRREHGLKGRPLALERFHVTLHHLGDYQGLPQNVAATVLERPFDVAFDRALSFSGKAHSQPLVPRGGDGLDALMAFQRALGAAMMKAGLGRHAEPSFTPPVTLLYDCQCVAEQAIRWTVREFILVHSVLWSCSGLVPNPVLVPADCRLNIIGDPPLVAECLRRVL